MPSEITVYMGIRAAFREKPLDVALALAWRVLSGAGGVWEQFPPSPAYGGVIFFRCKAGPSVTFLFCNTPALKYNLFRPQWCEPCNRRNCAQSATHLFADGVLHSMFWTPPKVALLASAGSSDYMETWHSSASSSLGITSRVVPLHVNIGRWHDVPPRDTLVADHMGSAPPNMVSLPYAKAQTRKWVFRGFPPEDNQGTLHLP